MILEDATYEAYGYYPSALTQQSNKSIIATCNICGKIRILRKADYRKLCKSCVKKGEKHPMYGKHHSDETKAKMSAAPKGIKSPRWAGGWKVSHARSDVKRRRDLGYTLLMPLKEGEVGHHITNEYVIGIPKVVHQHFHGYRRKKHRTLILQWLKANDKKKYKMVLCVLAKDPPK